MPKTNLKRMNRFELLELMYRIVTENERLTKRCEELERQLAYETRGDDYRSARESPRSYYDEPRTVSRREEILARVDEQSSLPRTRREARRPAPQQQAQPRSSAQAPRASVRASSKVPAADDFDIDSILEDYFSDLPFDAKGRDA